MRRWSLVLAPILAWPLAAQAPAVEKDPFPIKVSGYVTASYTWSNHAQGDTVVGRFYDRRQSEFMANALKLAVEKPVDPAKLSAGFRADAVFGQNAEVTGALGNRVSLGEEGDLWQAVATLNLPTGEGTFVQVSAGKMVTIIGAEVMEDVLNPNLSIGNQFIYLENFTNTGLRVTARLSPKWETIVAVFNGWDIVRDNNTGKSVMGRVGYSPTSTTNIYALGFFGPEQANSGNKRYGGELVLTTKLGPKTAFWAEADLGAEEGLVNAGADKATWWGVGGWLVQELSAKASLALRGDYINDRDGVRTSAVYSFPINNGLTVGNATATLNVKPIPTVMIRPELRVDFAGSPVFDSSKSQVTLALGTSFLF